MPAGGVALPLAIFPIESNVTAGMFGGRFMLLGLIEVPAGTRLLFQPDKGPLTHVNEFHDLGAVVRAERHADESADESGAMSDERMVLDCEGVEASEATKMLEWPNGESLMPGTIKLGEKVYPARLQLRAARHGLRAILRSEA
jgi:hypothetical protein